jgi:hypothetical protein
MSVGLVVLAVDCTEEEVQEVQTFLSFNFLESMRVLDRTWVIRTRVPPIGVVASLESGLPAIKAAAFKAEAEAAFTETMREEVLKSAFSIFLEEL